VCVSFHKVILAVVIHCYDCILNGVSSLILTLFWSVGHLVSTLSAERQLTSSASDKWHGLYIQSSMNRSTDIWLLTVCASFQLHNNPPSPPPGTRGWPFAYLHAAIRRNNLSLKEILNPHAYTFAQAYINIHICTNTGTHLTRTDIAGSFTA